MSGASAILLLLAAMPADSPASIHLSNADFDGTLCVNQGQDNPCCSWNLSGFRPFMSNLVPERNLFLSAGWNFEHIFNGVRADSERSQFSPRVDPCYIEPHSDVAASLVWPREGSSWEMDCRMTYALAGDGGLDITFAATPWQNHFGQGYVGFLWASYLVGAKDRSIYFYGVHDGAAATLLSFGRDWPNSGTNDQGVVPYLGTDDLPYEPISHSLEIVENDHYRFVLPFYYGLVDGDGNPYTRGDEMVFAMMFDQAAPVRFAMWNFSEDTHSPAWDWQYIVHAPEVGRTYGHAAHVVYRPFSRHADVLEDYVKWVKGRGEARHALRVAVLPSEAGSVFPPGVEGDYGEGTEVFFGVRPRAGWAFKEWRGEVHQPRQAFTGATMSAVRDLTAVMEPIESVLSETWTREPDGWASLVAADFVDDAAEGWAVPSGWSVIDGEGEPVLDSGGMAGYLSWETRAETWGAYRVRARFKTLAPGVSMTFRAGLPGQYILRFDAGHTLLQREFPRGVFAELAAGPPLLGDAWREVTIGGIQDELKVFVDGTLSMAVKDSAPLESGGFGVQVEHGGHVLLGKLLAERPEYRPQAPPDLDGAWHMPYRFGLLPLQLAAGRVSGGLSCIQGVYSLDASAVPGVLDVFVENENGQYIGSWRQGIYQREGNWLKIAQHVGGRMVRPHDFSCGPDTFVMALERSGEPPLAGRDKPETEDLGQPLRDVRVMDGGDSAEAAQGGCHNDGMPGGSEVAPMALAALVLFRSGGRRSLRGVSRVDKPIRAGGHWWKVRWLMPAPSEEDRRIL